MRSTERRRMRRAAVPPRVNAMTMLLVCSRATADIKVATGIKKVRETGPSNPKYPLIVFLPTQIGSATLTTTKV